MPERAWRRWRGALLRTAYRRPVALAVGLVLLGPSAMLVAGDYAWERWWTEGVAVLGAGTGAALVVAGLLGRRPDWIEPPGDHRRQLR